MKKFLVFVLLMAAIGALGYMLYPYAVEHFGQEKVLEFASKTGTNILYQDEEIKLITTMNLKEEYEIISFKIIINDEEDNYIITKNNNLLTSEKTLINTYKVSYEINIPKTISGRVSYTLDSFQYYNGETIEDYIFKEKKKLELNVSEYLFVEEVSFESLEFEADIPAIPLTLKLYDPYDLDLISIHFRSNNNDLFGEVIEKQSTDEEGRFMLYLEIPTPDFPQSHSAVDLNLKITGYTFILKPDQTSPYIISKTLSDSKLSFNRELTITLKRVLELKDVKISEVGFIENGVNFEVAISDTRSRDPISFEVEANGEIFLITDYTFKSLQGNTRIYSFVAPANTDEEGNYLYRLIKVNYETAVLKNTLSSIGRHVQLSRGIKVGGFSSKKAEYRPGEKIVLTLVVENRLNYQLHSVLLEAEKDGLLIDDFFTIDSNPSSSLLIERSSINQNTNSHNNFIYTIDTNVYSRYNDKMYNGDITLKIKELTFVDENSKHYKVKPNTSTTYKSIHGIEVRFASIDKEYYGEHSKVIFTITTNNYYIAEVNITLEDDNGITKLENIDFISNKNELTFEVFNNVIGNRKIKDIEISYANEDVFIKYILEDEINYNIEHPIKESDHDTFLLTTGEIGFTESISKFSLYLKKVSNSKLIALDYRLNGILFKYDIKENPIERDDNIFEYILDFNFEEGKNLIEFLSYQYENNGYENSYIFGNPYEFEISVISGPKGSDITNFSLKDGSEVDFDYWNNKVSLKLQNRNPLEIETYKLKLTYKGKTENITIYPEDIYSEPFGYDFFDISPSIVSGSGYLNIEIEEVSFILNGNTYFSEITPVKTTVYFSSSHTDIKSAKQNSNFDLNLKTGIIEIALTDYYEKELAMIIINDKTYYYDNFTNKGNGIYHIEIDTPAIEGEISCTISYIQYTYKGQMFAKNLSFNFNIIVTNTPIS